MRGFTLVELLVSITIVAILSTIGLIVYSNFLRDARDGKRQADLKIIQAGLEQYYADQFFYPDTATASFPFGTGALTSSVGSKASPPSPMKTYMNLVPADPQTTNPQYCYKGLISGSSCDSVATTNCDNDTSICVIYCLYAKLENPPTATNYTCGAVTNYNLKVTLP